jgi:four helix bundle protein
MVDFQNLIIWQNAHRLTLDVYKITAKFPKEEIYNLVSQMRRSSSSIATNIAEGSGRRTQADFNRFLYVALASVSELQYQLILSKDLQYISLEEYNNQANQALVLRKMMTAYSKKLSASQKTDPTPPTI